jgi:hypothetical protein
MAVMTSLALDTGEHHRAVLADVVTHALQMS